MKRGVAAAAGPKARPPVGRVQHPGLGGAWARLRRALEVKQQWNMTAHQSAAVHDMSNLLGYRMRCCRFCRQPEVSSHVCLAPQEDWGELNTGKKPPALFVLDLASWRAVSVSGLPQDSSAGQPVWTPKGVHASLCLPLAIVTSPPSTRRGDRYCSYQHCCSIQLHACLAQSL
jgi:Acylamino-acid-releasing enzyme, N-terminal domain